MAKKTVVVIIVAVVLAVVALAVSVGVFDNNDGIVANALNLGDDGAGEMADEESAGEEAKKPAGDPDAFDIEDCSESSAAGIPLAKETSEANGICTYSSLESGEVVEEEDQLDLSECTDGLVDVGVSQKAGRCVYVEDMTEDETFNLSTCTDGPLDVAASINENSCVYGEFLVDVDEESIAEEEDIDTEEEVVSAAGNVAQTVTGDGPTYVVEHNHAKVFSADGAILAEISAPEGVDLASEWLNQREGILYLYQTGVHRQVELTILLHESAAFAADGDWFEYNDQDIGIQNHKDDAIVLADQPGTYILEGSSFGLAISPYRTEEDKAGYALDDRRAATGDDNRPEYRLLDGSVLGQIN